MDSNQRRLSPSRDQSLWVRVLVLLTLSALVLAGCSPAVRALRPPDPLSVSGDGTVTHVGLTVTSADPGQTVTLAPPTLDQAAYDSLLSWANSGALVAAPVEVTLAGDVPGGGVTLTRTFPVALPGDVAVTFAYWDDTVGEWRAVPSDISPDRLSVSATVDHLSFWTTISGGAQQAMDGFTAGLSAAGTAIRNAADTVYQGVQQFNDTVKKAFAAAAEESYYAVGKIFDVRVDAPTCDGGIPDWADSVSFIETNRNHPILWCAGHDAQNPELLVVKARINRGYGSFAETAATPTWTYNSTYDQALFDTALAAVTESDQVLAQSVAELMGGGRLVGPGQEISFGFSEDAVRALGIGQPLVTLALPDTIGFLATSIAQAVSQSGEMLLEGSLAAVIGVASCSKDLAGVNDIPAASRAAITCISGFDDVIAQKVALGLLKTGMTPQAAGKTAGSILAKFTVWLALVGPVFNIMNYTADSMLLDSARTLTVFVSTIRTQDYRRYQNPRYGFAVDVPASMHPDDPPVNGDGQRFLSADGAASLIVWGSNNIFGLTPQQALEDEIKARPVGDAVTYSALVDNVVTVSGTSSDGSIFYTRIEVGVGSLHALSWSYPASQKDTWDRAVQRSAATFEAGDVSEPH